MDVQFNIQDFCTKIGEYGEASILLDSLDDSCNLLLVPFALFKYTDIELHTSFCCKSSEISVL